MSDRINRRATITQFHKAWHPPCEIFKHLKHEGVKRSTVYGIIKRYSEASSVSDKKKKLAIQLSVSRSSIRRAFKIDLGHRPIRRGTCNIRTNQQKKNRVRRCRALFQRHGGESYKNILFTDEKIFTVEEKFNRQNDRIYVKRTSDIPITQRSSKRAHHLESVMV
ncbi:hypothetical protein Fcan01_27452 [Folsomia candida]|uniref:Transposase Tc1-like domain-containing protein n=1 Tax=Folsomia candida TaxID=158441 RepID=A0A226CXZ0_FOLCA|nr:hypothetical protein Fcan01_27452 [Folsomia candida]